MASLVTAHGADWGSLLRGTQGLQGPAAVLDLPGDSGKLSRASVSPDCTAGRWQTSPSPSSRGRLAAGAELSAPWPHGETEAGRSRAGLGGPDLVCVPTAPSTPAAVISRSFASLQPNSLETPAAERPSPAMLY